MLYSVFLPGDGQAPGQVPPDGSDKSAKTDGSANSQAVPVYPDKSNPVTSAPPPSLSLVDQLRFPLPKNGKFRKLIQEEQPNISN